MKITLENWDNIFPKASMKFTTFVNGAYCPQKTARLGKGFNQTRYTTPQDIIITLNKREKGQRNPLGAKATKERTAWDYMKAVAKRMIEEQNLEEVS